MFVAAAASVLQLRQRLWLRALRNKKKTHVALVGLAQLAQPRGHDVREGRELHAEPNAITANGYRMHHAFAIICLVVFIVFFFLLCP